MDQLSLVRSGNHFVYAPKTKRWILIDGPWLDELTKIALSTQRNTIMLVHPLKVNYQAMTDESNILVNMPTDNAIIWHAIIWNNRHADFDKIIKHNKKRIDGPISAIYNWRRQIWLSYANSNCYVGFITGKGTIPCHMNSYEFIEEEE